MRDDLQNWLRVRAEVDWRQASKTLTGPIHGRRDAVDEVIGTGGRPNDPARGARVRAAWRMARADATAGRPLDFGVLCTWQKLVLGQPDVAFRVLPAFAKGGRERYGLCAETPAQFDECLRQATDIDTVLPLPARAARAYLDVCFFHPFDDGNGRAALLALAFVLAREGVVLDEVGPIQIRRYAEDASGARALARLIHVLATAAERRDRTETSTDARGSDGGTHRPYLSASPSTR